MFTDKKTKKLVALTWELLDDETVTDETMFVLVDDDTNTEFATLMSRQAHNLLILENHETLTQLADALAIIEVLDDNTSALLRIVDAQNEALQNFRGGAKAESVASETINDCSPGPSETTSCRTLTLDDDRAVTITGSFAMNQDPDEYQELFSLRKKRETNREQLSILDAKLKEYKKKARTLEDQRDQYKAWYHEAREAWENIRENVQTLAAKGDLSVNTVRAVMAGGSLD